MRQVTFNVTFFTITVSEFACNWAVWLHADSWIVTCCGGALYYWTKESVLWALTNGNLNSQGIGGGQRIILNVKLVSALEKVILAPFLLIQNRYPILRLKMQCMHSILEQWFSHWGTNALSGTYPNSISVENYSQINSH